MPRLKRGIPFSFYYMSYIATFGRLTQICTWPLRISHSKRFNLTKAKFSSHSPVSTWVILYPLRITL
jgi:hypothetical protein